MRTRTAVSAAAVALSLVAAGCGGDSAENLAEKAIEEASGGSADVDISDGTMKITTDTGNVVVSGDQDGVTVESDEGTFQAGANVKLPDGFPDAVPLPEGELTTAVKSNDTFALSYNVDDAEQAFMDYVKALESAGFELSDKTEGEMNGNFFGSVTATGKGWNVGVSATGIESGSIVGINVEPV